MTVRGAGVTLFASGMTLVIQVAATIVLARILTPADFGVVAMVTTFSLLFVNFGFNGLTEAIVQRETMTRALASTLFWISSAVGLILSLVFAGGGNLLQVLYRNPLVKPVAIGISLTIWATSLSTVHLALLKRAMRFSELSLNDICARFVSVTVSIVLGLRGWGFWALVVGTVAQPVSTAIGAFMIGRWVPGLPKRVEGTRQTVLFALHTYGNFAVNYASRNTDNLLVGLRFDAQALGFYKKAYDLFALAASQFVTSIAIVVVAGLSRVTKDLAAYRLYLLNAIALMAFAGMGLGAGLMLTGKDLVLVLLGAKWAMTGKIFVYFGPGIGFMILYCTNGWVHLSIGRPDRWLRWTITEMLVTCSLLIAGLHWGPIGIATAWSISYALLTYPAIWYAGKPIDLGIAQIAGATWRYIAASIVALGLSGLLMHLTPFLINSPGVFGALMRIAIGIGLLLPLYCGAVVALHGGAGPLLSFAGLMREMLERGKKRDQAGETQPGEGEPARVQEEWGQNAETLPLVSILIPAYNASEWIAGTIRSALAQTWPRTEIIVVDDGSRDDTLTIAREFEAQGVRVVVQKNQGASAARNNAYANCHGDYIQWLDADDLLEPDKITQQMRLVMNGLDKRVLLSCPWGYFMYRPNRANFVPTSLWADLQPYEWLLHKMDENVFMQTGAWLVSRELTEAAGPWDMRLLGDDDGEYFCRVLLASTGVRFVRDAKVYYRAFRFNGLSYIGRFPEKIEAHWLSMQLHIKYLRSLGENDVTRTACLQYMRDNLIYFYPERVQIVRQAEQLAIELGEPLGQPRLSWKFSWIRACFGWGVVKPVQHVVRKARWQLVKHIDHILFRIENREMFLSRRMQTSVQTGEGTLSLKAEESRTM